MNFIAFYLPQYHAIPENDAVYGKGFTEWDNVRAARPLFENHYQPHIPHKMIGWYSLLNEKFLQYQHDLAYEHGITGFCYYYYNFAGRTLLEEPLRKVRNNRDIKNSYCLCWAHSDWYDNRKGPGAVFVRQTYSAQNAQELYGALAPYFEDDRYITVGGRPFLAIWAPERNPMIRQYADILREESVKHGFSGLYLAGVEAYAGINPSQMGLDGMIEFAPNWRIENHVSLKGEKPVRIDYDKTLAFMRHKAIPSYTRLRCTFPGWDNTPRRGLDGIACVGAQPKSFLLTLDFLVQYTRTVLPPDLQYIFINAWNEWGEGCHLEPDERYGDAYLRICRHLSRTSRA